MTFMDGDYSTGGDNYANGHDKFVGEWLNANPSSTRRDAYNAWDNYLQQKTDDHYAQHSRVQVVPPNPLTQGTEGQRKLLGIQPAHPLTGSSGTTASSPTATSVAPVMQGPGMGHHIGEAEEMALYDFYRNQWAEEYDADGIANKIADYDDDVAYYQNKIANAGGTAQADYDTAMSTLAQNYAIYERLLGATADDTREDILALINEAGQADDLAMLDGDFGADYVTRGDIGFGVAGMDINPTGSYVSGDAAAALAAGTREAEMNRADLAARQSEENALIRSLSDMAGFTANARMNDAANMRRDEEATLAERLRKAQIAAAERRADLQLQLDRAIRDRDNYAEENGGTLDDYLAMKGELWRQNKELESLELRQTQSAEVAALQRMLNAPTTLANQATAEQIAAGDPAVRAANEIINNNPAAADTYVAALQSGKLSNWLRDNLGSY